MIVNVVSHNNVSDFNTNVPDSLRVKYDKDDKINSAGQSLDFNYNKCTFPSITTKYRNRKLRSKNNQGILKKIQQLES